MAGKLSYVLPSDISLVCRGPGEVLLQVLKSSSVKPVRLMDGNEPQSLSALPVRSLSMHLQLQDMLG